MNDFVAQMQRQQAKLDQDDAAAKAAGTVVGRYIQHPFADGHAVYKIVAIDDAERNRKVTIEHVDIGDAWVLPAWGRRTKILRSTAERFLAQRDAIAALFARTDDWWAQRQVGETVHYHNGFGQYIRGTIIVEGGEKKMLPTAMVGNWKQHDICTRAADSSVHYSYHAK